jgi:hypothetical protein
MNSVNFLLPPWVAPSRRLLRPALRRARGGCITWKCGPRQPSGLPAAWLPGTGNARPGSR